MSSTKETKKEEYKCYRHEVKLAEPLAEGAECGEGEVVLVANDGKTRFACNIKALKFYSKSKFAQSILPGYVVALTYYEMATAVTLQHFATWLERHETLDRYHSGASRDISFIRHFLGEDEDMTKHEPLMELAILSAKLQCEPLAEMISSFIWWQIKKAADLGDPVAEVERWCAGNVRNKNKTREETAEWFQGQLDALTTLLAYAAEECEEWKALCGLKLATTKIPEKQKQAAAFARAPRTMRGLVHTTSDPGNMEGPSTLSATRSTSPALEALVPLPSTVVSSLEEKIAALELQLKEKERAQETKATWQGEVAFLEQKVVALELRAKEKGEEHHEEIAIFTNGLTHLQEQLAEATAAKVFLRDRVQALAAENAQLLLRKE